MSQRALSPEQFSGYVQPRASLADLPEQEDEPLRSDRSPGRTPSALSSPEVRDTQEYAHHPYSREVGA